MNDSAKHLNISKDKRFQQRFEKAREILKKYKPDAEMVHEETSENEVGSSSDSDDVKVEDNNKDDPPPARKAPPVIVDVDEGQPRLNVASIDKRKRKGARGRRVDNYQEEPCEDDIYMVGQGDDDDDFEDQDDNDDEEEDESDEGDAPAKTKPKGKKTGRPVESQAQFVARMQLERREARSRHHAGQRRKEDQLKKKNRSSGEAGGDAQEEVNLDELESDCQEVFRKAKEVALAAPKDNTAEQRRALVSNQQDTIQALMERIQRYSAEESYAKKRCRQLEAELEVQASKKVE